MRVIRRQLPIQPMLALRTNGGLDFAWLHCWKRSLHLPYELLRNFCGFRVQLSSERWHPFVHWLYVPKAKSDCRTVEVGLDPSFSGAGKFPPSLARNALLLYRA